MKILNILILGLVPILFSCKENKHATNTPAKTNDTVAVKPVPPVDEPEVVENKPVVKPDSLMAFIVSFYSIGEGIDRGQPEKLKEYVESYGKKANTTVAFTETFWGREGERDYCFPLNNLSAAQVKEFAEGVKSALKESKHVHYFENQACRKGR